MATIDSRLPQDSYLQDLLRLSHHLDRNHVIAVDHETSFKATITDLITTVCEYRIKLGEELGTETLLAIREGKTFFIATILPPSYEFLVASLAIHSLGAGLVPLSTKLLPEEAAYYITQSASKVVICDQERLKLVNAVPTLLSSPGNRAYAGNLQIVCMRREMVRSLSSITAEVEFDPAWTPSLEAPSLILFTSGTSGSPKGAVFPRQYLYNMSRVAIDALRVTSKDVFLHSRGVHWVSGVRWSLGIILAGARVEFCESLMSPAWWCSRVAQGGVTMCYEMPRIWMSIMRTIESIQSEPSESSISGDAVKAGLKSARLFMSGGTPAIKKVINYWNETLQGGSFINIWGITELGGMITYHEAKARTFDTRYVGRFLPNISVRFDEEGQIYVKSPLMFLGYVSDPERTQQVLDSQGFFKTGDAADVQGDDVHLLGRIGLDYIRFKGLKMCAAEVEEKINELHYVQECAVVPVPDEEFGQRVAVVLQPNHEGELLSLQKIRADSESSLPQFKLPTILALVDTPLPRTANGKLAKSVIRQQYLESQESPGMHLEKWHISYESGPRRNFMWDWAGMH